MDRTGGSRQGVAKQQARQHEVRSARRICVKRLTRHRKRSRAALDEGSARGGVTRPQGVGSTAFGWIVHALWLPGIEEMHRPSLASLEGAFQAECQAKHVANPILTGSASPPRSPLRIPDIA